MNSQEFYQLLKANDGSIIGHEFNDYIAIDFKDFEVGGFIYFELIRCSFKNGFAIKNFDNTTIEIVIKDTFITNLKIAQSNFRYLYIDSCKIKKIDLYKLDVTQSVSISCKENELIRVSKIVAEYLEIDNLAKDSIILLNNQDVSSTIINAKTKIKDFRINEAKRLSCFGTFEKIQIISNNFESIDFSSYHKDGEEMKTIISNINIESDNIKGALLFNGVKIQDLAFISVLSQSGVVQINNAEIENTSFLDSTFKNIYLNNVSFQKTLDISNSDLSALKYANIDWIPKTKFSCTDLQFDQLLYNKEDKQEVQDNIRDLRSDREVYRQLKSAATSMQNHIDAMEFHRLEMRLYWKDIRFTKSTPWQNRVLVFFDRWVSDFGQNWWLPLIWLFGVHFILFMCIFQWNFSFNIEDIENGLGQYFTLLNPVHKTPDYINTGMGVFTEFWMRVLGGFFIYHFVRATRRYGKG